MNDMNRTKNLLAKLEEYWTKWKVYKVVKSESWNEVWNVTSGNFKYAETQPTDW